MKLRNVLFLYASQVRLFWASRGIAHRVGFQGRRRLFGARNRLREGRIDARTFFDLVRLSMQPIVLAAIVATVLQIVDSAVIEFADAYFGGHLRLLTVTADIYGTLLATITGAGAVLIGLYYAATTAIAGAIYAQMPNNIRDLLAGERIGIFYMRVLALITYLGVVLLAFRAAGLPSIKIAIPLMSLAAGIALISFIQLGARAFNLFDPTTFSTDLFEKLRRTYSHVTSGSYRWFDPSFQTHAHAQARSALDAFDTLADLSAKKVHLNGRPFLVVCRHLVAFLIGYNDSKKRIPTESLWFARRYTHQDWYRTEDSTTSLMLEAAGRLQPKQVSDAKWIESRVLPIAGKCFALNLEHKRYDIAVSLLTYIDSYVGAVSDEGDILSAHEVLQNFTRDCGSILFTPLAEESKREPLELLAIVDNLAAMPITILLRYSAFVIRLDREFIANAVRQIDWMSRRGIYETGLPRYCVSQLEWLSSRLEFEIRSEGYKISPDWYLSELVRQPACDNAKSAFETLFIRIPELFDSWFKSATAAGLHWLASTILSRENEFWSKVDYHFHRLETQWDNLNAERRVDGLAWAKLDLETLKVGQKERGKELLMRMSKESTALSRLDRPDEYPDFAGQFLHKLGDAVLDAMIENDGETVSKIFSVFFVGSLLQFERLRSNVDFSDWRGEIAFKVAIAPVLDLMDISGFGLVFGALHDNDGLTGTMKGVWDRYLADGGGGAGATPKFFAAALSLTEAAFELAHRSMIRSGWRQKVQYRLGKVNRHRVQRGMFSQSVVIDHHSALVRVFSGDELGSFHDGIDAFISEYLLKRDDGRDVDFGYRHMEFAKMVTREEQRAGSSVADDEDELDGDG